MHIKARKSNAYICSPRCVSVPDTGLGIGRLCVAFSPSDPDRTLQGSSGHYVKNLRLLWSCVLRLFRWFDGAAALYVVYASRQNHQILDITENSIAVGAQAAM